MDKGIKARNITLYFTILCALFIGLSPQFFGFMLPIIFIIPIYMGVHGMKRARKSGYLIALGVVPLALAVSVLWINYFRSIAGDVAGEITRISSQYKITFGLAKFVTMGSFILSLVMFCLSILVFIKLIKNKSAFR